MTATEEGTENLEVRTKWPNEGHDFTPWLAENLDLLGEEIGIRLELVQQEKAVGPMSLDILARDTDTKELVAIENQLEWTDTHHLGQLLTYATGCDAHVAIWVATEFRHEYATALHKLNEWTNEKTKFYGVKIELVRKTDGAPAEPRFRKVVYPGGWDIDNTLPLDPPPSPSAQKHLDFFQPLIEDLIRAGFADRAIQYYGYTGRFFRPSLQPDTGYAVSFDWRNSAWVSLHIQTWDNELTDKIFDELHDDRKDIEASIDAGASPNWQWLRHDAYSFSSISVRKDASIDDPPEKLEKVRSWMFDLLPKFKEVFDPRVSEILNR